MDDRAEVFGSEGQAYADVLYGNALRAFSKKGYGYAVEKAGATTGWSFPIYEEIWNYGFPQEMEHFVACVREGTEPTENGSGWSGCRRGRSCPLRFGRAQVSASIYRLPARRFARSIIGDRWDPPPCRPRSDLRSLLSFVRREQLIERRLARRLPYDPRHPAGLTRNRRREKVGWQTRPGHGQVNVSLSEGMITI